MREGADAASRGPQSQLLIKFVVWMKGYLLEKFTKTNVLVNASECLPIRLLVERFENANDTY